MAAIPTARRGFMRRAAETYLPLLDMIGEAALHRARPALTIGLTPVLLEQLAHPRFKKGFVAYLKERMDRARQDRKEFEKKQRAALRLPGPALGGVVRAQPRDLRADRSRTSPAEFAARCREGHIELLTSNATHAYMPLLLNDEMITAQMTLGTLTSEKRLGLQAARDVAAGMRLSADLGALAAGRALRQSALPAGPGAVHRRRRRRPLLRRHPPDHAEPAAGSV